LSGGGVRAAVFHLGVLRRLATDGLLERVTFLSTVSGGSMVTGLVYTLAGNRWPTSAEFLSPVFGRARTTLTSVDVQGDFTRRIILQPWLLRSGRAKVLSKIMQDSWQVGMRLNELADVPRWVINATTFQTGKDWQFMRKRM